MQVTDDGYKESSSEAGGLLVETAAVTAAPAGHQVAEAECVVAAACAATAATGIAGRQQDVVAG